MNMAYKAPELEVIRFESEDVIVASTGMTVTQPPETNLPDQNF